MSSIHEKWEDDEKREVIEYLQDQIKIEGELIVLYEDYVRETENKPIKRIMHTIGLDCHKHIDLLQACIEIIKGEDVLLEDKKDIKENLSKHIKIEEDSIKKADKILRKTIIQDNKGLTELIKIWRDDEKRHTEALKKLADQTYFRLSTNDWVGLFRDEMFLEERYVRSKKFQNQTKKD
jgi:hypothetical protein